MRPESFRAVVGHVLVFTSGSWERAGTCFCIPAWNRGTRDLSYFVTARHVVIEAVAWGRPVKIVIGAPEIEAEGRVVAGDETSDLALLEVHGVFDTSPCSLDQEGGPVVLIGYPAAFARQELTHAEWRTVVPHVGKDGPYEIISLYCEEIAQSVPSLFPGSPLDLWKGLSGGPCVLMSEAKSGDLQYALGVVISVAPEGVAGRVSCASMRSLQGLCFRAGLCLEFVEPVHHSQRIGKEVFGEILRGLTVPSSEQHSWNQISNLFFHESGIIRELENSVVCPREYGVDSEDIPFIEYFLGRLWLKKGNAKNADRHFNAAVLGAQRIEKHARTRLQTLIGARRAAEHPLSGPWTRHFERLKAVRGRLENIPSVGDDYKSLELASLIGWQSMKLFLRAGKLSAEGRLELGELARGHIGIVEQLKDARPNQEVVSTALRILVSLWSGSTGAIADVEQESLRGFIQAKARHNSIFFIQMLLARALVAWQLHNLVEAYALALLVAELLKSLDLTLEHEGIAQLNAYIVSHDEQLKRILSIPGRWHNGTNLHDKRNSVVDAGLDGPEAEKVIMLLLQWLNAARIHKHLYEADADDFRA
jgi:hypothetical protein